MKFSHEKYVKMIAVIRKYPCIYDSSMQEHKDYILQRDVWKQIADEMDESDMTWEDWKKIWKQKRDSFTKKRRELLTYKTGSAAAQRIKKSPLFAEMSFLVDHISGRSSASNLAEAEASPSSNESICDNSEFHTTHEMDDDNTDEDNASDDETYIPPSVKRVKVNDMTSSAEETTSAIQATSTSKTNTSRTPIVNKCTPMSRTVGKYISGKVKKKKEQELDRLIDELQQRRTASTVEPVSKKVSDDDDGNVFVFLSKAVKRFSKATQEWMEDEVLGIYAEAKRRDNILTSSATGPAPGVPTQYHQPAGYNNYYSQDI